MGSTQEQASNGEAGSGKTSAQSKAAKMHKRSRSGCFTCRLRRKKCDEGKPKCKACRNLGLDCDYKRPTWWNNNDLRRKQKDQIKTIIKRTKSSEKSTTQAPSTRMTPPGLSHSVPTSEYSDAIGRPHTAGSPESDDSYDGGVDRNRDHDHDHNHEHEHEHEHEHDHDHSFDAPPGMYDSYAHHMYPPHFSHGAPYGQGYSYEVDVKTERQMYVNDIPTRRDSSISTFSTFMPPPAHATLPSFTGDEYVQHDVFETRHDEWNANNSLDFDFFDYSHGSSAPTEAQAQTALIPVDDCDKGLLDHFIEHVLPLVFPILDLNQHGSQKSELILPALEKNKAYLHSCLSAAAVHSRATGFQHGEVIDGEILRQKFAFVTEVVNALGTDTNHLEILEATLGMISLQCCTGRAEEPEKDIPWHQHFQAATELVVKLDFPATLEQISQQQGAHPPFNMTLTAWIDILGSTMMGRAPTFANTYRTMHLSAASTGLAEIMGCHDNVMYLLSEVACLDALRTDKRLDDIGVCSHITSLAGQLDATESPDEILDTAISPSGAIKPRQLSKNITAIFRKAVRIYLCSLVPAHNRYDVATVNLIAQVTDMLQFVPSGPQGYDRSLVWPLLICGAYSIPTSPFRRVLAERIEMMGPAAHQGSFSRMVKLLYQVWRRNDGISVSNSACEMTPVTTHSPGSLTGTPTSHQTSAGVSRPTESAATYHQPHHVPNNVFVHWRDVMRDNGWDFLLV